MIDKKLDFKNYKIDIVLATLSLSIGFSIGYYFHEQYPDKFDPILIEENYFNNQTIEFPK